MAAAAPRPELSVMANLYVSVLDKMAIPVDAFGDSTGRLPELADL
jgi:hypothetical protein